tara:strand:+ start:355 stop:1377 length:1023 start_codon:yes stop_codon:yes gene_type:complete
MFKKLLLSLSLIFLQYCAYQNDFSNQRPEDFLFSEIEELANSIEKKLEINSINKIAIMDYTNLSNKEFANYFSDEISLQLFLKEKFQIIERNQLEYIINEQKLGSSGLIDNKSAINIGNILSVDAIIIGEMNMISPNILITTKVISVETGEILFLDNLYISDNSQLNFNKNNWSANDSKKIPIKSNTSIVNKNDKDFSKLIKQLSKNLFKCIKTKEYKCFKQYLANKDDLRKIFLITYQKDKKIRRTKIKNLDIEYNEYRKKHRSDFLNTIKRINSRKINWNLLEIKKVDYKVIKDFDQKKLFKVDLILKDGKNRIHIGFNTFKMNGKWIVNDIDIKRKK